jgi:hypothetical protein
LQLPDGWELECEDDVLTLFHPEGFGAVQVSHFSKADRITDEDLLEFVGEDHRGSPWHPVRCGAFVGYRVAYSDERGRSWIMWYLRAGAVMLYVTYNCVAKHEGREADSIAAMLESLRAEA